MAITDYTIASDADEAIVDKFEMYVYPDTATGYQKVGVVSNTQTIDVTKEFVVYDDGTVPWLFKPIKEELSLSLGLMQTANIEALALILGKDTIDSTTDTLYKQIDFNKALVVPPKLKTLFVGESADGKSVEIFMLAGQNRGDSISMSVGTGEVAQGDIKWTATYDEGSTEAYDVGYIRVEK